MDKNIQDDENTQDGHFEEAHAEEERSMIQEFLIEDEHSTIPKQVPLLTLLYELTKIDKELAEIEEEKGDLPDRIVGLTGKVGKSENSLEENISKQEDINTELLRLEKESKEADARMTKLDEQKYSVKNNKEYDEIMKAIDKCFELIDNNEKKSKELAEQRSLLLVEKENAEKMLAEFGEELKESQKHLDELNSQYETEELELQVKRKELIVKVDAENRELYERINMMYKGEGTAILRKGNCSGCYNSVPTQQSIEIRAAIKVFTCQSCGRILIDEKHITN